jgi:electron transfer flavoprotein beta subunit
MKILVCVKEVADLESRFSISADAQQIEYAPGTAFVINRYEEYALEEALSIRDALPSTAVDVVSVGPRRAQETIRKALGMGAQNGIHILCDRLSFQDSWKVAALIAAYAGGQGYDLLLTGAMAEDTQNGQTGPMIAAHLGLPFATTVLYEKLDLDRQTIYAEREIDALTRDQVTLRLPALLTVQSGINRPRYPTLTNMLRASKQAILTLEAQVFPEGRGGRIARYSPPPQKRASMALEGTTVEKARALCHLLRQRSLM